MDKIMIRKPSTGHCTASNNEYSLSEQNNHILLGYMQLFDVNYICHNSHNYMHIKNYIKFPSTNCWNTTLEKKLELKLTPRVSKSVIISEKIL